MSENFSAEELRKLPEWAREKIRMQDLKIRAQGEDIVALTKALDFEGTPTRGSVEIDILGRDRGFGKRGPRCYAPGTSVDFHLGHGRLHLRMDHEGELHVTSTHGCLTIRPQAANVVRIVSEG